MPPLSFGRIFEVGGTDGFPAGFIRRPEPSQARLVARGLEDEGRADLHATPWQRQRSRPVRRNAPARTK
jgi:hypothetical protein